MASQFLIHKWTTIWTEFINQQNSSLRFLLENILNHLINQLSVKTEWRAIIFRGGNLRSIYSTSLDTFGSMYGLYYTMRRWHSWTTWLHPWKIVFINLCFYISLLIVFESFNKTICVYPLCNISKKFFSEFFTRKSFCFPEKLSCFFPNNKNYVIQPVSAFTVTARKLSSRDTVYLVIRGLSSLVSDFLGSKPDSSSYWSFKFLNLGKFLNFPVFQFPHL